MSNSNSRVLGLGGLFFTAEDPKALAAWYQQHLGFDVQAFGATQFAMFSVDKQPAGSYGVWSAFDSKTEYFQPSTKGFMLNLMVDDLSQALKQVEAGGATLVGEPESHEYGHFGWFMDPEGNKIELWQPPVVEQKS